MKIIIIKLFKIKLCINILSVIISVLDIIYFSLFMKKFFEDDSPVNILSWYFIIWFLTSIVYHSNERHIRCELGKHRLMERIYSIVGYSNRWTKIIIRFIFSLVYIIKYFLMMQFVPILVFETKKYYSTSNFNPELILKFLVVLIFIIFLMELLYLLDEKKTVQVILIIIVLIIIFGFLSIQSGIIEWVFLALVFNSVKDMLSSDIKYLKLSDEIRNLYVKDSRDDTALKRRMVELKYSLLLLIPFFYFSIKISEELINTEIYINTVCKISENQENRLLEFIIQGEVKFIITFLVVFVVYSFRKTIFKVLIERIILKKEEHMYDYLIVGAGLSGAIFAHEATNQGKKVKVIDKRDHIGGNIYCENVEGINVHKYGAHIFHTSNKEVWDYVNQFAEFNNYINSPVANYKGKLYNLPFNMNTFYGLWGTKTPAEVKAKISEQTAHLQDSEPKNLEEQAIKLIGTDVYETLIKGYTEKQWGRSATELPPFIIKRLPVRFTFDNNYFNDRYQGIPIGGYNVIIENMLKGIEVELNVDFFENREELERSAKKVVFTGMIDQYFDYKHGELEYRSLRFEHEVLDEENYQGNAVVNYTEREVPYTRIIEHKHFEKGTQEKTVITREYSVDWKRGDEPYYPINDAKNNEMYQKYLEEAKGKDVIFCGRLADYKYYDMHVVIERALNVVREELNKK